MPPVNDTTAAETASVRVPLDVHQEMKVALAYRKGLMSELVRSAWEAFKREQGDRLHARQEQISEENQHVS